MKKLIAFALFAVITVVICSQAFAAPGVLAGIGKTPKICQKLAPKI